METSTEAPETTTFDFTKDEVVLIRAGIYAFAGSIVNQLHDDRTDGFTRSLCQESIRNINRLLSRIGGTQVK